EALGWEPPKFGHMTLIINAETGKKLSKRDTEILQFIEDYRELAYLPDALFNFISLLGWSAVGEEEIFTPEELIEIFDYERLGTSPSAFDANKLYLISNQYLKELDLNELIKEVHTHLQAEGYLAEDLSDAEFDHYKKLASLYQDQTSYTAQLPEVAGLFFDQKIDWSESEKEV